MAEYKKPPKYYPTIPPTTIPPTTIPPTTIPPTTIPPTTIPPTTIPPTTAPPTAPPCDSKIFWIVEPGDTLYTIASQSGTTVTRLLQLNPHVNPNNLQAGTRICLP